MPRRTLLDALLDDLMDDIHDRIQDRIEEIVLPAAEQLARGMIREAKRLAPTPTGTGFKSRPEQYRAAGDTETAGGRKPRPRPPNKPQTTFYDLLEVSPRASQETIEGAWKALAKKWHPDHYKGPLSSGKNADRMAIINHAHDVLSDPGKRKQYDRSIGLV